MEVAMGFGAATGVPIGGGLQEVRMKLMPWLIVLLIKNGYIIIIYIYIFAQELCWLMHSC